MTGHEAGPGAEQGDATAAADPTAPLVVDARGLRCPIPVIRLAAEAREHPGRDVVVLWTDPAARHDIPAWARMRGHTVVGTETVTEDPAGGAPAHATTVRITPSAAP